MVLVQALRLYLAEGLRGGVGWLFALADKQMSAAINAMHDDPARRWTLQSLAERAGMSRTTFTLKIQGDGRGVTDGIPDALAERESRCAANSNCRPFANGEAPGK